MQRQRIWMILSLTFLAVLIIGCNRPLTEDNLVGYDQGKKRFKWNILLANENLDNGTKGYKLETLVHFAIGNKANLKTERTAYLNKDFSVHRSSSKHTSSGATTEYEVTSREGGVDIAIKYPNGTTKNVPVDSSDPLLIELHANKYTDDLKLPGEEKTYKVLYEVEQRVTEMTVKYVGPEKIYKDGDAITTLHYKIQVVNNPEEWDDYYIDPKTKQIRRVQFGMIKFVPEEG